MVQNMLMRIVIYDASYAVGFLLMLLLSLLRCRAYGISRARAAVYSFITFLSGLAGAFALGQIYDLLYALKKIKTDIHVEMLGAVIFTSLFLLAAVSAEKQILKKKAAADVGAPARTVSFRDTMDLMIPGSFLVFACIKLGCAVRGCCFGVEWSWGVFSPYLRKTVFPVQLFESAGIFIIIVLCYYIKQTGFYRRGMAGPLAAGLYGLARFGWETMRFYTPEMRNFAGGFTLWQLFCVLTVAVAAIWLTVLYKTRPPEPMPQSRAFAFVQAKLQKSKRKNKKAANGGQNAAKRKGHKKKKAAAKRGGKKRR